MVLNYERGNVMKEMLNKVIEKRDTYDIGSEKWELLNQEKANLLETMKPSTKEKIIVFNESDLKDIGEGFISTNTIPDIPFHTDRRAILEHHPLKRHPIP